jgi:hypothetical protein
MRVKLYHHVGEDPETFTLIERWSFDPARGIRRDGRYLETVTADPVEIEAPEGSEVVEFGGFVKLRVPGHSTLINAEDAHHWATRKLNGFSWPPVVIRGGKAKHG